MPGRGQDSEGAQMKYTEKLLGNLRQWLCDNAYTGVERQTEECGKFKVPKNQHEKERKKWKGMIINNVAGRVDVLHCPRG